MADPDSQAITPLRRQCICSDTQCRILLSRVMDETPTGHVWRKGAGFTAVKFSDGKKDSRKVEALRRAIVLHLKLDPAAAQLKVYYVSNTHWPVAMLKEEGSTYRTTPLDAKQAQHMDAICHYDKRFYDKANCFATLMKSEKRKDTNLFVKAPVCTIRDVKDELDAHLRHMNRRPPPVVSTNKKVKFVLDGTVPSGESPDCIDPVQSQIRIEAEAHSSDLETPLARSNHVDESPDDTGLTLLLRANDHVDKNNFKSPVLLPSGAPDNVTDESLPGAESPDRDTTAVVAIDPAHSQIHIEAEAHSSDLESTLARSDHVDESPNSPGIALLLRANDHMDMNSGNFTSSVLSPSGAPTSRDPAGATALFASPKLLPRTEEAQEYLAQTWTKCAENMQQFLSLPPVIRVLSCQFWVNRESTIRLHEGSYLVKCDSFLGPEVHPPHCSKVVHRTRIVKGGIFCETCRAQHDKEKKRSKRKLESGGAWSAANSRCKIQALSPETSKSRIRNLQAKLRTEKARTRRLTLQPKQDMVVDCDDDKLVKFLGEVMEYCNENDGEFRKRIIKAIIESQDGYDGDRVDVEELEEYASSISTLLKNEALKLSKKPKQVRFDLDTMRKAMCFFLEGESGYRRLRESSLEVFPSPSTLYRVQSKLIPTEGECASLYGWFRDERDYKEHGNTIPETPTIHKGTVMCDEAQLKADIYCNFQSGETQGFTASEGMSTLNLASEVEKSFKKDMSAPSWSAEDLRSESVLETIEDYHESHSPACKANLWRLRTLFGDCENLEYFFNNGFLSSDELAQQLLRVILCLEIVGVEVHQLCLDAGGNNTGLMSLLIQDQKLPGGWLGDEYTSFQNPFDPNRRIYIVPCSVHGQKAMRNNLLKSQPDLRGTRCLEYKKTKCGWDEIVTLFGEDVHNETRLSRASVAPDRAGLMSVPHAMAPFQWKTVSFHIGKVAALLNCEDAVLEAGLAFTGLGYETEKALALLKVLKESVKQDTPTDDRSRLFACEYTIWVYIIYIARFLDTHATIQLTTDTRMKGDRKVFVLDDEIELLKRALQFFEDWKEDSEETKEKGWQKKFIAAATYRNMKKLLCGFIGWAKSILHGPDAPLFVSYSHSHQSTVENIFSQLRAMGRASPATFSKGMLSIRMKRQLDTYTMQKSRMYDPAHLGDEKEHVNSASSIFYGRKDEDRSKKLAQWKAQREIEIKSRKETGTMVKLLQLESLADQEDSNSVANYYLSCTGLTEYRHFSDMLFDDLDFQGIAKISVGGDVESFFSKLWNMDEQVDCLFDELCQSINQFLVESMDSIVRSGSKRKSTNGIHRMVLEYSQQSVVLEKSISIGLPKSLQNRLGLGAVVVTLARLFECRVRLGLSQFYGKDDGARTTEQDIKKQVNRFVGFGICKAMKKAVADSIQLKRDNKEAEDNNESSKKKVTKSEKIASLKFAEQRQRADARYEFIAKMRIFLEEAMSDPHYLSQCYEGAFMIQNMGFLTLVSPRYFEFGTKLLTVASAAFTQKSFEQRGNNVLSLGREEVDRELPAIREVFLDCSKDDDSVSEEDKIQIFDIIVRKTVNAWFGAQLRQYRNNNTGRQGKAYKRGDFRPDLESKCRGGVVSDTATVKAAFKAREDN